MDLCRNFFRVTCPLCHVDTLRAECSSCAPCSHAGCLRLSICQGSICEPDCALTLARPWLSPTHGQSISIPGNERDVELRFHLHRLEGGGGGGMTDGAALEEDDLPLTLPLSFPQVLPLPLPCGALLPPLPADCQSTRSMKCLIRDCGSPSFSSALSKSSFPSFGNWSRNRLLARTRP